MDEQVTKHRKRNYEITKDSWRNLANVGFSEHVLCGMKKSPQNNSDYDKDSHGRWQLALMAVKC